MAQLTVFGWNFHKEPEDATLICKYITHEKWITQYTNKTQTKGRYQAQVLSKPLMKTWFHKSNLDSTQLKQILRLRSGHTYDKKIKFLMKVSNDNLCHTCNTIKNAEHIIEHSTKTKIL